ncbi:hypothetical protein A2U01_0049400, partial [Trifolium medium]|nr:hypothetical protein [Trifolium medium]
RWWCHTGETMRDGRETRDSVAAGTVHAWEKAAESASLDRKKP